MNITSFILSIIASILILIFWVFTILVIDILMLRKMIKDLEHKINIEYLGRLPDMLEYRVSKLYFIIKHPIFNLLISILIIITTLYPLTKYLYPLIFKTYRVITF